VSYLLLVFFFASYTSLVRYEKIVVYGGVRLVGFVIISFLYDSRTFYLCLQWVPHCFPLYTLTWVDVVLNHGLQERLVGAVLILVVEFW